MNYQNKYRSNQMNGYSQYSDNEPSCHQLIHDITGSIYKITKDISDIKKYIFNYINKDNNLSNFNNDILNIGNYMDPNYYKTKSDLSTFSNDSKYDSEESFEDINFDFLNYSDKSDSNINSIFNA